MDVEGGGVDADWAVASRSSARHNHLGRFAGYEDETDHVAPSQVEEDCILLPEEEMEDEEEGEAEEAPDEEVEPATFDDVDGNVRNTSTDGWKKVGAAEASALSRSRRKRGLDDGVVDSGPKKFPYSGKDGPGMVNGVKVKTIHTTNGAGIKSKSKCHGSIRDFNQLR